MRISSIVGASCVVLAVSGVLVGACGGSDADDGTGGGDTGIDSGTDGGVDTKPVDSGTDVAKDTTPVDSGSDVAADTTPLDTLDSGTDVAADTTPVESGADVAKDTTPTEAGRCCDSVSSIVEWQASSGTLPTAACPAFTLVDTAAADPALASSVLTIDTASDGENMFYEHDLTHLAVTPGTIVVVEAKMRLVSGSAAASYSAPAMIAVDFASPSSGTLKTVLFIEAGKIFVVTGETARGPDAVVDTTGAAHTYRMEVHTDFWSVHVFVDGVEKFVAPLYLDPTTLTNDIRWGEASSLAHGKSEWHSFKHNVYTGCAVP